MANVPKAITDLPVASAMGDDDLLVVSQNATTSSIKGELIKGYAQNAVASQVTAAQTAANQAGQSATQAEAARQGAAAAQTAAESAQNAAETARDQSVAAAGTIGDSVERAQTAAGQASSAKDAAVSAQTAAEIAKTAAESASGQAKTAATQAAGSATAAQTAATQAGDAKTDAETARNEAETSASSAANSASDAESAATEAEQAKTYIENMDMEGETLPAGSSVTVTKTTSPEGNLLFVIGVPQGIQGDKGDTGETGATGPQGVSVTNATVNEDGDLVITLSSGSPINAGSVIGPRGEQGEVGPTGASVDRIERTYGTGAPGTTDTYTVYLTDGETGGTFQVYNGSNGTGSGDFMADGSVPMTGDLQMGGHVVTGMADGTNPTDGATVGQLSGKLDSPSGGTAGQVLTKTANGSAWENAPSGLPDGGTEGQMLYKSADGAAWGDKPVMVVTVAEGESGLTSNKTVAEIKEAHLNGFYIFVNYSIGGYDNLLPLFAAKYIETDEPSFDFVSCVYSRTGRILTGLDVGEIEIYTIDGKDYTRLSAYSGGLFPLNEGNQGEILYLSKDDTAHWGPAPKGIPDGGTTGQLLTKTETGEAWQDGEFLPLSGGTVNGYINFDQANSGIYFSKFQDEHNCYPTIRSTTIDGKVALSIYTNAHNGVNNTVYPIILTGVDTPKKFNDAANKIYVDGKLNNFGAEISNELDTKLTTPTGTQGQLLGFTADNTVGAVDAPESGLTQEQADDRYLQLSGGALTGNLTIKSGSLWLRGVDCGIWGSFNSSELNFVVSGTEVLKVNGGSMSLPTGLTISGVRTPTSDSEAANKSYVDSKAPTSVTVTLTTSGWSSNTQTVTVSGVVASETAQLITPTPAIASQSAYYEAGIMCTGQAANRLTFTCQTVPTRNLTVYVVIQPLS